MDRSPPSLSVIVPVFNAADTLAIALTSILRQESADLEIIVVDDGSTDNSIDVSRTFGAVVTCVSQANQGPAAARNHGIGLARGALVSFLDADDCWPADRIRHHMRVFAQNPEADIVIGTTQMVDPATAPAQATRPLLPAPLIQHQLGSATYRRRVFDRVGLFDPALRQGEDREWFLRAMAGGASIQMTRAVALEYRIRAGSLTYGTIDHRHWFLAALQANLRNRRLEMAMKSSSPSPAHEPGS